MPGPLDTAERTIPGRLRSRFGRDAGAVERLPLGADARARVYRVRAGDEDLLLKTRLGAVNRAGLDVPSFLADRGIPHLITPIPTVTGTSFDDGDVAFVLYPFVEGASGGIAGMTALQWTELGATMRAVHDLDPEEWVGPPLPVEDFVPTRIEMLREVEALIDAGGHGDPAQRRVADVWRYRRDQIREFVARTEDLAPRARERAGEAVICHGDIHAWNVLVTPDGGFVIIDWDSAMLAPRERDLMFVDGVAGGHAADPAAFEAGYGDIAADPVVLAYYRTEWAVQDLAEFAASVFLDPYADAEAKTTSAERFTRLFALGSEIDAVTGSGRRDGTDMLR